jgi:hypothetical protein
MQADKERDELLKKQSVPQPMAASGTMSMNAALIK